MSNEEIVYRINEEENNITQIRITADGMNCNTNHLRTDIYDLSDKVNKLENFVDVFYNKINELEEKENDIMMEARQITRLYFDREIGKINKECDEKIKEYKESNAIVAQYEALTKDYLDKINELYINQIPEDKSESDIDNKKLAIIKRYNDDELYMPFIINKSYTDDKIKTILSEAEEKKAKLTEKIQEIDIMLGICNTREEIIEVLSNYDIVDKKGKLKA